MSDPGQTDLIEFLAGEAATAAPRSLVFHGSAGMMLRVHYEHRPHLRQMEQANGCVHIEHTGPASRIENKEPDAEPNAATPMSPRRLLLCLTSIGWSERELARRTGRLQTTVRRWTNGQSPVPAAVAAWVKTLAACHQAHPAPRAEQGSSSQPVP